MLADFYREVIYTPPVFRSRPSTKKILVARPVFRAKICRPSSFSLKNYRPSCPAPKLVARPFIPGRVYYKIKNVQNIITCIKGSFICCLWLSDMWLLILFLNSSVGFIIFLQSTIICNLSSSTTTTRCT